MDPSGGSDLNQRPRPTSSNFLALVKARQGATDGDRSSYLDDPSIKPNLGADAEY